MSVQVFQPFELFHDINGHPVDDGYIWVGQPNIDPETNQISVFFDDALTVPATQPIRTRNGYPSNGGAQARLYVSATTFSVKIEDKNGTQISQSTVINALQQFKDDIANSTDPAKGAGMVGWGRSPLTSAISSVGGMLSAQWVSLFEFADLITDKPDPEDPATWDWHPAFVAAFNTGLPVMMHHSDSVRVSASITVPDGAVFNGANGTIIFEGAGVLFDMTAPGLKRYLFSDIRINPTQTTSVIFDCNQVRASRFQNIIINNTGRGFNFVASFLNHLEWVNINHPRDRGIYIQGDGGAEYYFNQVYIPIAFDCNYGIEIERTTINDVGAYYWENTLVVRTAGNCQHGIYIHGPVGQMATTVLNMVSGGSDGFNSTLAASGRYALRLENVANNRISNAWCVSIGMDNTDFTQVTNSNTAYGFYLSGANANLMTDNLSMAEVSTAFTLAGGSTCSGFMHSNIRCTSLTNDAALLATRGDLARTLFSHSSTSGGAILIADVATPTNRKYLRMAGNTLAVLPSNFGASVLEIENGGNIRANVGGFFGKNLFCNGVWNTGTLQLGNYHLWVDATGDLRIKNGAPTSDLDGTVVGTQS